MTQMGTDDSHVNLKEFFIHMLDERDRRYDIRFQASELALRLALSAQERITASALSQAEKASNKADTFMARTEMISLIEALEDKLVLYQSSCEKRFDMLRADISSLRESRSQLYGGSQSTELSHQQRNWLIGIVVSVGLSMAGLVLALVKGK